MVGDTFLVAGDDVTAKNVSTAESCRFENSKIVCKEQEYAPISHGLATKSDSISG